MKDSINTTQLVVVHNPFRKDDRSISQVNAGTTLQQIADENLYGGNGFVGSINGVIIPREQWPTTTLSEKDCIVFVPILAEGDGKSILNIIAMIAISVFFAPAAAGWIAGSTTGMAYMASYVAIVVAGGLLISSLTPSPKSPKLDSSLSQSYSWTPQTTQQQGLSVPRYYGKSKVYGNVINVFTNPKSGDNTKEELNVLIAIGRGPVKGIVTGTILLNDSVYTSYSDVSVEEKRGLVTQSAITLFTGTKAQYGFNRVVVNATPITYITPSSDFDDLEVELSFPRGIGYANDSGGLSNHTIGIKIEIKSVGGAYSTLVAENVVEATTETVRKTYVASGTYTGGAAIAIANGTKYEIKVTKTSSDQADIRYADKLVFSSVREIFEDGFTYPRTALLAIKALATDQLSGSFRFSCTLEGLILNTYNGSTWTLQYSSNPAWVLWDILTQPVILGDGSGTAYSIDRYEGIDPSRLDLAKFYELAQFCDDLVPDGEGGTEKRIEFNGGFDAETSMWDAVAKVCEVARCSPVWLGTTITLAIDKSASVVQMFSDANINVGTFKETFLSLTERVSEVEVQFNDELQDYNRTSFSVVDDDITSTSNKTTLALLGITKASAAWRAAMYRLAQNRLLTSVIEFEADVDAIAITIGDVIIVQSSIPNWGKGGKVVSATASTAVIDQDYSIVAVTDKIFVRSYNSSTGLETIQEKTIASIDGFEITISGTWTTTPSAGDVYAVGVINTVGRKFRVIGLSKSQDQYVTITGVDYNADIYSYDSAEPSVQIDGATSPLSTAQNIVAPADWQTIRDRWPDDVLFRNVTTETDIPLLNGLTTTNDSPSAGSVAWSACTLTYKGTAYSITGNNTADRYIYWDANSAPTTFKTTNTMSTAIGVDKWVMGINDSGDFYLAPGFLILHAGLIQASTISAISAALGNITSGEIILTATNNLTKWRLDSSGLYGAFRASTGDAWSAWKGVASIISGKTVASFDAYVTGDTVNGLGNLTTLYRTTHITYPEGGHVHPANNNVYYDWDATAIALDLSGITEVDWDIDFKPKNAGTHQLWMKFYIKNASGTKVWESEEWTTTDVAAYTNHKAGPIKPSYYGVVPGTNFTPGVAYKASYIDEVYIDGYIKKSIIGNGIIQKV